MAITDAFLDQKRVYVCGHVRVFKKCHQGVARLEWLEGKLNWNYLVITKAVSRGQDELIGKFLILLHFNIRGVHFPNKFDLFPEGVLRCYSLNSFSTTIRQCVHRCPPPQFDCSSIFGAIIIISICMKTCVRIYKVVRMSYCQVMAIGATHSLQNFLVSNKNWIQVSPSPQSCMKSA